MGALAVHESLMILHIGIHWFSTEFGTRYKAVSVVVTNLQRRDDRVLHV